MQNLIKSTQAERDRLGAGERSYETNYMGTRGHLDATPERTPTPPRPLSPSARLDSLETAAYLNPDPAGRENAARLVQEGRARLATPETPSAISPTAQITLRANAALEKIDAGTAFEYLPVMDQAALRKTFPQQFGGVGEPEEPKTELVNAALDRITTDIYKNKQMLDKTDPANRGGGLLGGLNIVSASGDTLQIGGDRPVEIGEEARKALDTRVAAKQDTLANLTAPAVEQLGIQTYQEYFERKTALEGALQQYDTIEQNQGKDAAEAWLKQATQDPDATRFDLATTYQLFNPPGNR